MTRSTKPTRSERIYLVAILLAAVALLLGIWDVAVERDSGDGWLAQLVLPVGLLFLFVAMYRRSRRP